MLTACEAGEVFALLEGGAEGARSAGDALCALYSSVREPWLTRALLLYHARTGSARALELLARAPEPHVRHLLDQLHDQLRADRAARHHALSALAPLVARRPPWLHRLPDHPLARDLVRAALRETDALPLLHALLALAALLPAAPALATSYPQDLTETLLRPAHIEQNLPPPTRAHLHLGQLALFRAIYATHPCTLLKMLRDYGSKLNVGAARAAWERAVASLASSVRLHPAILTGSQTQEADTTRWARREIHDVVAETHRLSIPARDDPAPSPQPMLPPAPTAHSPAPGSGAHAARAASALRPGAEPWFPLAERCGGDSAPPTPLPADTDTGEPPEAAVEATPENTPARDTRAQFRFPMDSGAVRAIGRKSRGASPPRKETSPAADVYSSRLARVVQERRAVDSPVPFSGTQPSAGVTRPEPSRPAPLLDMEPFNVEDREVLELTRCADVDEEWPEGGGASERAVVLDARRRARSPGRGAAAGRERGSLYRAASCDRDSGAARRSVAVQTVDLWPEPYEFIIADFYRTLPDDTARQGESSTPCERLETYLAELYAGRTCSSSGDDQVALLHAQLMYERWRREAHAERNRRLLGRCRQVRALELRNQALAERVRALTRERDELRACALRDPPPPPPPPADPLAALHEERAARLRAEAALHEAEAMRAHETAELQRQRGDAFEVARHVDALARAALAAERRAEHVKRLRRELLVLAEREARLSEAVREATRPAAPRPAAPRPAAPRPDERSARAALARAEAEAEAATARAELAAARAHELETTLAARDAAIGELKRATRAAAEEGAARLQALQDKYSSLLRLLRAADARQLELRAEQPPPPARAPPPS